MKNDELNEVIEKLKKDVRWEYNRKSLKESSPDNEQLQSKPDVEIIFEENVALAILLLNHTVFLNSHWWEDEWPTEAKKVTSLNVNTNDVLAWGCADACEMMYSEIQEVYEYWEKDPNWGTAVWYCKKMNMLPQKPVYDRIQSGGIWNLDEMNLDKNPDSRDE